MSIDKSVNNFLENGLFLTYNTTRLLSREAAVPQTALHSVPFVWGY